MPQEFVADFPVDLLIEHPENARRGNVGLIGESIEVNGFYGAVVVQRSTSHIIVGNHRARAARELGLGTLPVLVLDVDDDQARRIMLADNRTNDVAFYDDGSLAALLASLDGDLSGTGFVDSDLELLLAKLEAQAVPELPPDDEWSPPPERVREGDLWQVGPCRFLCADTMDPEAHKAVLGDAEVMVAFTSPPYANRRKYDPNSPFEPVHPDDYVEWFAPVASNVSEHLAEDGSWFVNIRTAATGGIDMETYVLDLVLAHIRRWGWHWAEQYCWERVGVPKSVRMRFKPAYELIYQFVHGPWRWRPDNVRHYSEKVPIYETGNRFDWSKTQGAISGFRTRESAENLAYPSTRLPTFMGEYDRMVGHPAAFPYGLAKFFTLAYSDPGNAVFDPFAGSGSTLVGASMADRPGYGIEISPLYCDMMLNRLEDTLQVEGHKV